MRIDEFDWSNLVILDACRHDLYEEVYGETRRRRTVASSSEGFIEKTFGKGNWSDVVVITANPHYYEPMFEEATGRTHDIFEEVYCLFEDDEYWDDEIGTVKPGKMFEAVDKYADKHPRSRFLIHFMQPHTPFLVGDVEQDEEKDLNVWDLLQQREYTEQEVWKAYKENLMPAREQAVKINSRLIGTTYITADHGNAFGENGEYGHPTGSANTVLRYVPLDFLGGEGRTYD